MKDRVEISVRPDFSKEEKERIDKVWKRNGMTKSSRVKYLILKDISELEKKDGE